MMDPSEVEFLAEQSTTIRIVPNFSSGVVPLLQGDVGPFRPGLPMEVPVWVALSLRQRQKCRVLQPDWMDVERLEEAKEQEKQEVLFTELPCPDLFVVANLILDVAAAAGDLGRADEIRTVIKDIWDIRQSKLRKVVDTFVLSGSLRATLNNVQLIELNSIRPLLPFALDQIHRLEMASASTRANRSSAAADRSNTSLLGNSSILY